MTELWAAVLRHRAVLTEAGEFDARRRAQQVENKTQELRARRKELQIKLRGSLELFAQILEADSEDEKGMANVHTMLRKPGA